MAASDHVNPYQMKLFMQAKELMHVPSDDAGYGTSSLADSPDIHEEKLSESHYDWDEYDDAHGLAFNPDPEDQNLYESIKKSGVTSPVSIRLREDWDDKKSEWNYRPILTNGNHRTVVAHDINPEMYLPVKYVDRRFED